MGTDRSTQSVGSKLLTFVSVWKQFMVAEVLFHDYIETFMGVEVVTVLFRRLGHV
jgi:hypothetical protein